MNWKFLPLVLAAIFAAGCVDRNAQQQAKRTETLVSDQTVPVIVAKVATADLAETLEITGSFTTAEDTSVGAKTGGRLVAVYVKDGDVVKAGQTIALQETTDAATRVRQQQALVDASRSQLQQAKNDALIGPSRSAAAVRASEARLKQAQTALEKLKNGARAEERVQADWAVENAKKNMQTAKQQMERSKQLFDQGAVPKSQVERDENAYMATLTTYNTALENQRMITNGARSEDLAAAQQQIEAAREQLNSDKASQRLDVQYQDRVRAAQANLRSAEESLALARQGILDATIKAPFAGRVSGRPTQAGTYVGPGTPIVRIVGSEGVYFEGEVQESRVSDMKADRPVTVKVDALGTELKGSIVAVNPLGADVGRVFKVRVQIFGDTSGIKPGMFGRGVVEIRTVRGAMVIPSGAVITQGAEKSVFVVQGDKAKRVKVTTGLSKDGLIQVDGLTVGQNVVTEGQTKLADGTTVKVDSGKKA
jgi:RND family efflux transporter MFP subunit